MSWKTLIKPMVKTNYSTGSADFFYEKTGGLFMYSVSRPKKDGFMLFTCMV